MMMVAHEKSGKVVASQKWSGLLTYEGMRAMLEKRYPGCLVLSPMQSIPAGTPQADVSVVTVQLQRSLGEVGRVGDKFFEWVVIPDRSRG